LTYLDWTPDRIRGQSILLKPNLVRPQPDSVPAATTDPRVILALIDLCRDWGASKVAVGDNPGWGFPAREAFQLTGLDAWIEDHGGIVELFDREEPIEIDNPQATVFRKVLLPPQARRYDIIINLPKLKTHMHTIVSLGIKNLYGFVTDSQRLQNHRNDLHRKLVDFLYILKPDLTIIDGIWALEGQAPLYGVTIPDMGVLIGSEDIVAVDAVGTMTMGIEPNEVTTTRLAHYDGFGNMDLKSMEFVGIQPQVVRRQFQRAVLSSIGAYPEFNILEGGACTGCQNALRHALDRLAKENKINPRTDTIILGRNPAVEQLESLASRTEGKIWCFGDCTEEIYRKLEHTGNVVWVGGCAPHIFDYYLAYVGTPRSTS
jgi:uncharacterized protein (DUF362 family)